MDQAKQLGSYLNIPNFDKSIFVLALSLIFLSSVAGAQIQKRAAATATVSQRVLQEIPPGAKLRHDALVARLDIGTRDWISTQVRNARDNNNLSEASLRSVLAPMYADSSAKNIDFAAMSIEDAIQIILFELAVDAEQDLKAVMQEMEASKKQKSEQRQNILVRKSPQPSTADPINGVAPAEIANIEFRKINVAPQNTQSGNRLDSMSNMSETESLRLQMAMDRRSNILEALSNIMKKRSETEEDIIGNMK